MAGLFVKPAPRLRSYGGDGRRGRTQSISHSLLFLQEGARGKGRLSLYWALYGLNVFPHGPAPSELPCRWPSRIQPFIFLSHPPPPPMISGVFVIVSPMPTTSLLTKILRGDFLVVVPPCHRDSPASTPYPLHMGWPTTQVGRASRAEWCDPSHYKLFCIQIAPLCISERVST
jgi:hypothetical protein